MKLNPTLRISCCLVFIADCRFRRDGVFALISSASPTTTTHGTQQWLARFLSTYQGTLITVSHDEALLEGVKLSVVAEVANQRVEVFKGCGFKKFLFEREERMK